MEPKYNHGTISVVFKIKKKCVCLYNIPFFVGSVSVIVLRSLVPGNRACCLSFHLPSASIRRPCSYSLSSQGGAFPAPIQTQLQETSRKRLPSGLDSSWGPLVGELWEAREEISTVIPVRKKGYPGTQFCPFFVPRFTPETERRRNMVTSRNLSFRTSGLRPKAVGVSSISVKGRPPPPPPQVPGLHPTSS